MKQARAGITARIPEEAGGEQCSGAAGRERETSAFGWKFHLVPLVVAALLTLAVYVFALAYARLHQLGG
jgi:hypothetical protein